MLKRKFPRESCIGYLSFLCFLRWDETLLGVALPNRRGERPNLFDQSSKVYSWWQGPLGVFDESLPISSLNVAHEGNKKQNNPPSGWPLCNQKDTNLPRM